MLAAGRDELICDLAETYGILDYRTVQPVLLATLAQGLRDNSRIKLLLAGARIPMETALLGAVADHLAWLHWAQTQDARNGRSAPDPVLPQLLGIADGREPENTAFSSPEAFEAAREKLLKGR